MGLKVNGLNVYVVFVSMFCVFQNEADYCDPDKMCACVRVK